MADIQDYVAVFESSDGGSGDPGKTFWQFFVGVQPVSTTNPLIAETMQLAIKTNSKVRVNYDPAAGNTMSQARIEFKYVCNSRKIQKCEPPNSSDSTQEICETLRYGPCHKG
ncbi:MAG TPA: hypothetical protein VIW64_16860 [Pyrinomonadaceae bacterium]|jgi:hypothetical protein